jgi:hypothetical protein
VAAAHGLREIAAWPIGLLGIHCVVYELPVGADRDAMLDRLRRDSRVESAQPYQAFATLTSDSDVAATSDPYRPLQRNLDLMDVGGAHLWSRGEGVRVAVIDTGIDASHPDLAGRIVKQENFVDGSKSGRDRHGTAVAGVIAAVENNSQGIVGVAPGARLYAMRACWPAPGDDSRAVCSTLTLAKAMAAAIEARIDIVNLSLTGPADPLLTRLVEVGLRRGVVFVGATPPKTDVSTFPTGIPGVIGVDAAGAKASADSVLFAPGTGRSLRLPVRQLARCCKRVGRNRPAAGTRSQSASGERARAAGALEPQGGHVAGRRRERESLRGDGRAHAPARMQRMMMSG